MRHRSFSFRVMVTGGNMSSGLSLKKRILKRCLRIAEGLFVLGWVVVRQWGSGHKG
jgi:hypothetical protein